MDGLIWLCVGFAVGMVAARIYWSRAIGYARAKESEFRAWAGKEFRKL